MNKKGWTMMKCQTSCCTLYLKCIDFATPAKNELHSKHDQDSTCLTQRFIVNYFCLLRFVYISSDSIRLRFEINWQISFLFPNTPFVIRLSYSRTYVMMSHDLLLILKNQKKYLPSHIFTGLQFGCLSHNSKCTIVCEQKKKNINNNIVCDWQLIQISYEFSQVN